MCFNAISKIWITGTGFLLSGLCVAAVPVAAQEVFEHGYAVESLRGTLDWEGNHVSVEGCFHRIEEVGAPNLPLQLYRVVVPPDFNATGVRVLATTFTPIPGSFQISPVWAPIPTDGSVDPVPPDPDPAIYGSKYPFPPITVELLGEEFVAGYRVVTLRISPLRYYPQPGNLEMLTHIEFQLEGKTEIVDRFHARRRSQRSDATIRGTIAALVENDEKIGINGPPTLVEDPIKSRERGDWKTRDWPSLEGLPVDYLIISSDAIAGGFKPLAQWKQEKGLNTVIRTISDIKAKYPGVDTQERIRNFIIEAGELWGVSWVLLGGDTDQFPERQNNNSWGPTDLYYATADGNWNANGNAIFGEGSDDVDEGVDWHVGRAPVEDLAEVGIFVDKVLNYEQSPPPGFAKTALLMGANSSADYPRGQYSKETVNAIILGSSPSFFTWRLYNWLTDAGNTFEGDELLNHDSAMAHLNAGYNLVNHIDHCGIYVMGMGIKVGGGSLTTDDVMSLTNGSRQGVLWTLGCSPNAFDYDSISEAFLNNPNGGAAAFIGNTRYGVYPQESQDFAFFRAVLDTENRITAVGEACSISRMATSSSYQLRVLNLLGDPEMRLWSEEPSHLQVVHPSMLAVGKQQVTVEVYETMLYPPVPVVGAQVCFYEPGNIFDVGTTGVDGTVTLEIACETIEPVRLTVTAMNHVPYQVDLAVSSMAMVPYLYVSGFDIDDDETGSSNGNGDGCPDAGETLEIPLDVTNGGGAAATDVIVTLTSLTPEVAVLVDEFCVGDIDVGETVTTGSFVVVVDPDCSAETFAEFSVQMSFQGVGLPHTDTFWFRIHAPDLRINGSALVDDGSGQSQGNGNGIAEPGETVEIYMELANPGHGVAREVTAVATSNHQNLVVLDDTSHFGDISPMNTVLAGDPIVVDISINFVGDETLTLEVFDYYMLRGTFILDLVAPPAPTGLGFESGADYIYLTWEPVPAADLLGYHVYRSEFRDGPFLRLDTLVQAGSSLYYDEILLTGISSEGIFFYYITAVDESGNEGLPSDMLMAWINYPQQSGWPIELGGHIFASATAADVDGDGTMEIFVGGLDGKVYGFYHDGTEMFDLDNDPTTVSGFAVTEGTGVWGAPAIGDLDRDGSPDVIVTSRGSEDKVYAWSVFDNDGDGAPDPVPGWPVFLGDGCGRSLGSPAIGDVDADGWLEVVFTTECGGGMVHVIDGRGFEETGWPQTGLENWTYTTPALGHIDLAGDVPTLEIIVGGRNGSIYAWDCAGNLLPGWPVATGGEIDSSPALGDLDGDGFLEILQNSHDGYLYALEADGTDVVGWEGGKWYHSWTGLLGSPVLADIDGDNLPEVFLTTRNGIAAWCSDGTPLPGWPVTLTSGGGSRSSPAVADIDGDLEFEILVGTGDERVYAVAEDGTPVAHWPAPTGEWIDTSPTVEDLDNDGDLEVIAGAAAWLYIWDCTEVYPVKKIQWGTFHAGIRRDGLYDPIPPSFGTGDFDIDGDVDLADFAGFQACFRTSDVVTLPLKPPCRHFDFEPDDDVDLDDYSQFCTKITGP
ncbi:MAG: VCBS repeat-containing protein [Phycisphaerae bacterium]|nr:VCBS repeat-containing protein [Phycisphaerae bacterium]